MTTLPPDLADAITHKVNEQLAHGDAAGAEQTLRHAIGAAPDLYLPFEQLAQLLLRMGRPEEADAAMREALIEHADNADAHGMFGMRLSELGQLPGANWHLRRAIQLGRRHPALLSQLGQNLVQLGEVAEGEPLLAEAAALEPGSLLPVAHQARALELLGHHEEARAALSRAEEIARPLGQDLTLHRAFMIEQSSDWRDALDALRDKTDLPGVSLLLRGRLKDRAGDYPGAWTDFVQGKAQLAAETGLGYDRDGVDAHAARLRGFFSAKRFAALPRAGIRRDVPQPLFILGFPRSGTTLTEQVLTNHSRIRAGDELPFTGELVEFTARVTGKFPDGLASLVAADRRHLVTVFRDFYLARAEAFGLLESGAAFFTDKMPLNEIYLPLLRLAFPEAPMLVMRRHPLDILVSAMGHGLTHGFNCGFALGDTAHHLATTSALLEDWAAIGADAYALRYEDLVADPEGQAARLMNYLGLDLESAQLRFHESRRLSATPSQAQVRQPVHDRSIGRWRHYADALAPILDVVAPAMARDGYTL
ncbi:MAG: sulfotransferase [Sphingomonas sp.]|uniref:sulfotransferase family protein n=1 Tax=Sphingomonas sp. TaxID=28214 RepID=UPI003F7DA772